jgi:hypothetical protein
VHEQFFGLCKCGAESRHFAAKAGASISDLGKKFVGAIRSLGRGF